MKMINKKRSDVIQNNEISEIVTYDLGGYLQKVLIEGKDRTSPVVIFFHGGPGIPIPFCVGSRGMFPEFTNKFVMVYWDQLGCGANNRKIDDTFTINDYVDMSIDLVKQIKNKFPNNKLILFGVSWGSILATLVANQMPQLIDRVVIYGQIIKDLIFNEATFNGILCSKAPNKVKEELMLLKEKDRPTVDDLKKIMIWIRKYTQGYLSKEGKMMPIISLLGGILTSPDYTVKDAIAVLYNGTLKNRSLLAEAMSIDLSNILNNISIPYLILQGDTDIVTPTSLVEKFVNDSNNSNLEIKIIEKSGHSPSVEGMEQILEGAQALL